jgi:hypothetical protein
MLYSIAATKPVDKFECGLTASYVQLVAVLDHRVGSVHV